MNNDIFTLDELKLFKSTILEFWGKNRFPELILKLDSLISEQTPSKVSGESIGFAMWYDHNHEKIVPYNAYHALRDAIDRIKRRKDIDYQEFERALHLEVVRNFWSRSEYELILTRDENDKYYLSPWVGCRNPEEVTVEVTDDPDFDWKAFAEFYDLEPGTEIKIDIYTQLNYRWRAFCELCWNSKKKD